VILVCIAIVLFFRYFIDPFEQLLLSIVYFIGIAWAMFWSTYMIVVLGANIVIKRHIRLTENEIIIKVPLGRYNVIYEPFVFKYMDILNIYSNKYSNLDYIVITFKNHEKIYKLEKKDIPNIDEFLKVLSNKVNIILKESWATGKVRRELNSNKHN
jgi:hypothetical protein